MTSRPEFSVRIIFSLAVLVVLTEPVLAQEPAKAEDLEQAAIRTRLAIRSGYVRFQLTERSTRGGEVTTHVSERETWVDGNKVRAEFTYKKGPDQGVHKLECRNCEREGWGILATDRPGQVTEFYPLDTPGRPPVREAIDPRNIGYSASIYVTLANHPVARAFDLAGDAPKSVTKRVVGGREVIQVSWDGKNKAATVIQMDPARGGNISRIEHALKMEEGLWKRVMVSDLVAVKGVWFPSRVVLTETMDGKVREEETIEVHEFRPNVPIPPEMFTLAGTKLKPEPSIMMPNQKQTAVLRDGKLETPPPPKDRLEPPPPEPLTPPKSSIDPWMVGACAACAVGVVAVVLIRRKG